MQGHAGLGAGAEQRAGRKRSRPGSSGPAFVKAAAPTAAPASHEPESQPAPDSSPPVQGPAIPASRKQVPRDAQYGTFEAHTKGFGTKYLAKFNFPGRLGKHGQGIAVPVAVAVRPHKAGLGAAGVREASTLRQNRVLHRDLYGKDAASDDSAESQDEDGSEAELGAVLGQPSLEEEAAGYRRAAAAAARKARASRLAALSMEQEAAWSHAAPVDLRAASMAAAQEQATAGPAVPGFALQAATALGFEPLAVAPSIPCAEAVHWASLRGAARRAAAQAPVQAWPWSIAPELGANLAAALNSAQQAASAAAERQQASQVRAEEVRLAAAAAATAARAHESDIAAAEQAHREVEAVLRAPGGQWQDGLIALCAAVLRAGGAWALVQGSASPWARLLQRVPLATQPAVLDLQAWCAAASCVASHALAAEHAAAHGHGDMGPAAAVLHSAMHSAGLEDLAFAAAAAGVVRVPTQCIDAHRVPGPGLQDLLAQLQDAAWEVLRAHVPAAARGGKLLLDDTAAWLHCLATAGIGAACVIAQQGVPIVTPVLAAPRVRELAVKSLVPELADELRAAAARGEQPPPGIQAWLCMPMVSAGLDGLWAGTCDALGSAVAAIPPLTAAPGWLAPWRATVPSHEWNAWALYHAAPRAVALLSMVELNELDASQERWDAGLAWLALCDTDAAAGTLNSTALYPWAAAIAEVSKHPAVQQAAAWGRQLRACVRSLPRRLAVHPAVLASRDTLASCIAAAAGEPMPGLDLEPGSPQLLDELVQAGIPRPAQARCSSSQASLAVNVAAAGTCLGRLGAALHAAASLRQVASMATRRPARAQAAVSRRAVTDRDALQALATLHGQEFAPADIAGPAGARTYWWGSAGARVMIAHNLPWLLDSAASSQWRPATTAQLTAALT